MTEESETEKLKEISKRHHYVSQFYLRNFSDDGRRVYEYHIASSKVRGLASVKGRAYEENFHVSQLNEDHMGKWENRWSKLIRAILRDRRLPVKDDEIGSLQLLMLIQHVRTKRYVDEMVQVMRGMLASMYVADADTPATVEDFDTVVDSVNFKDAAPFAIQNSSAIVPYVADLSMLLLRSVDGDFVTSDNPAFFYNPYLGGLSKGVDKAVKGVQMVLPISPAFCLLLYDASTYDLGLAYRNRDLIPIRGRDRSLLNRLQVLSANEAVYWCRERSAREVERLGRATKLQRKGVDESYDRSVSEEDGRVRLEYWSDSPLNDGKVLSFLKVNKEARDIHPEYRHQVLREYVARNFKQRSPTENLLNRL